MIKFVGIIFKKELLINSITNAKLIGNPLSFNYELKLFSKNNKLTLSDLFTNFESALERIKQENIEIINQKYNTLLR